MKQVTRWTRLGLVAIGLFALPLAAQTAADPNRTMDPVRATPYETRDHSDFNWGWLGLLGLVGLAGMRHHGKRRDSTHVDDTSTRRTDRL